MVGYPHDIKGQGIYAYVTLMSGDEPTEAAQGTGRLGAQGDRPDRLARPHPVLAGLPKTRSGKIMRRILRKIAENEYGSLGDTSTLADPDVVEDLIDNRQNRGKG